MCVYECVQERWPLPDDLICMRQLETLIGPGSPAVLQITKAHERRQPSATAGPSVQRRCSLPGPRLSCRTAPITQLRPSQHAGGEDRKYKTPSSRHPYQPYGSLRFAFCSFYFIFLTFRLNLQPPFTAITVPPRVVWSKRLNNSYYLRYLESCLFMKPVFGARRS